MTTEMACWLRVLIVLLEDSINPPAPHPLTMVAHNCNSCMWYTNICRHNINVHKINNKILKTKQRNPVSKCERYLRNDI